jgi:hypothetical protein
MLVVRRPVKVVGSEHERDPLPMQLAIGVLVALGVVASVWLIGYIGYRLGFAPMVRQGVVTRDGRGEAVVGIVMMLIGENSRVVVDRISEKNRNPPRESAAWRDDRHLL